MITSSQNPKIKLARALGGQPKARRKEGAFLAEGVRLVEEALTTGWPIRFVLFAQGLSERGKILVERLQVEGFEVEEVEPKKVVLTHVAPDVVAEKERVLETIRRRTNAKVIMGEDLMSFEV